MSLNHFVASCFAELLSLLFHVVADSPRLIYITLWNKLIPHRYDSSKCSSNHFPSRRNSSSFRKVLCPSSNFFLLFIYQSSDYELQLGAIKRRALFEKRTIIEARVLENCPLFSEWGKRDFRSSITPLLKVAGDIEKVIRRNRHFFFCLGKKTSLG